MTTITLELFFNKDITSLINKYLNYYIIVNNKDSEVNECECIAIKCRKNICKSWCRCKCDKANCYKILGENRIMKDIKLICYLYDINSDVLIYIDEDHDKYAYIYNDLHRHHIIKISDKYSYYKWDANNVLINIKEKKAACFHCEDNPGTSELILHVIKHSDVIRYYDNPLTDASHLKKILITNDMTVTIRFYIIHIYYYF